jgi:hypothetical protein
LFHQSIVIKLNYFRDNLPPATRQSLREDYYYLAVLTYFLFGIGFLKGSVAGEGECCQTLFDAGEGMKPCDSDTGRLFCGAWEGLGAVSIAPAPLFSPALPFYCWTMRKNN